MSIATRVLAVAVVAVVATALPANATIFFRSGEEAEPVDQGMPNPPWDYLQSDSGGNPEARGFVRGDGDCAEGARCIEWTTTQARDDLYNEVNYDTTPLVGAGPYYFGFFYKAYTVDGIVPFAAPNGSAEQFGKTIDLLGQNWRWVVNIGVRAQNGPDNTYGVFVGNPTLNQGHFNPACEVYDSYWNNLNGYGRGLAEANDCQPNLADPYYPLSYDRWYAIVFKLVLSTTNSGEIGLWINGTKVMEFTGIRTAWDDLDHRGIWHWQGTLNQPNGPYPNVRLRGDAFVYTDDLAYLQDRGYFADPEDATSLMPPAAPSGLSVS